RIEEMSRKARVRLEEGGGGKEGGEKEELLAEMLAASLKSVGLLGEGVCRFADLQVRKRPAEFYENWLSASVAYLQEQGWVGEDGKEKRRVRELEEVWREWEERKRGWARNGKRQAEVRLLEVCLRALPGILRGEQQATEVMFPGASLDLVEGF